MRRLALLLTLGSAVTVAAQDDAADLAAVLQRAGERVERYFTRAQSIVCREIVRWMPLTPTLVSAGFGRTVESELRLSWAPADDGTPANEARTIRELLRVNGREPQKNDWRNCTDPEQQASEPQPLSILLPAQRGGFEFKLAGRARLDGRSAIMVDYKIRKRAAVTSSLVEGRDDCVTYNIDGGTRGRVWIDADTYDVLRLDQALIGMVDIPLPKKITLPFNGATYWTAERMDTTIRFKAIAFNNPDETLVLPVTMTQFRITRGAGTSRLWTTTDYTQYRRFLTAGRIVPQ